MGHHFVPQRYLKGFKALEKEDHIWMFDKRAESWKLLPIAIVAQAREFYEPEIERSLNTEVEQPGNDVIDKIRRGEPFDDTDRMHLCYYVATMMRRVPLAREKAKQFIPGALDDVVREMRGFINQALQNGEIDRDTHTARIAELEAAEKKYRHEIPDPVRQTIEAPWPFTSMLFAIDGMFWRFLKSEGPSYFLTNDNPAHYFEGYGLGNFLCELVFPMSREFLLHCSWARGRETVVEAVTQGLVKTLNRRIATGADRCVFYHEKADWVASVVKNTPEQNSRIEWVRKRGRNPHRRLYPR